MKKKFSPIASSIDSVTQKIIDMDHLPDEDPDARECPYCDGYGHLIDENGKAKPCECVKKEIVQAGIEDARIPVRFQNATLDTFNASSSYLKSCLFRAREFVQEYSETNSKGLYIYGQTGCGKTHLAVGILKGLIERGYDGVFYNVVDLLDMIRQTYSPDSSSNPQGRLMQEQDRQIIVLDDFGVQKTSVWVVDRLYALINRRYQDCKTIIITSNIKGVNLSQQVEKRLVSRILDMCEEIEVKADDFRLQGKQPPARRKRPTNLG